MSVKQTLEVEWRVSSGEVVVSPTERTALLIRTLRPASLRYFRVELLDSLPSCVSYVGVMHLPSADVPVDEKSLLIQHGTGIETRVACYADLPVKLAQDMPVLLSAQIVHPATFWLRYSTQRTWLNLNPGQVLGVVVEATQFGRCRVEVGGF